MKTCECGSLIIDGACTNPRCGTGNHVHWARFDLAFYVDAKANRLVRAKREVSMAREILGIGTKKPMMAQF